MTKVEKIVEEKKEVEERKKEVEERKKEAEERKKEVEEKKKEEELKKEEVKPVMKDMMKDMTDKEREEMSSRIVAEFKVCRVNCDIIVQGSRSPDFWAEIRPYSQCQKECFFPIQQRKFPI